MRILTVVGARPQFIKSAPVTKALAAAGIREIIVHTGQHYDHGMSEVFFEELQLPVPAFNLGVGRVSLQADRRCWGLERLALDEKPDCVLVYVTQFHACRSACRIQTGFRLAHVEADPILQPRDAGRTQSGIDVTVCLPAVLSYGHSR